MFCRECGRDLPSDYFDLPETGDTCDECLDAQYAAAAAKAAAKARAEAGRLARQKLQDAMVTEIGRELEKKEGTDLYQLMAANISDQVVTNFLQTVVGGPGKKALSGPDLKAARAAFKVRLLPLARRMLPTLLTAQVIDPKITTSTRRLNSLARVILWSCKAEGSVIPFVKGAGCVAVCSIGGTVLLAENSKRLDPGTIKNVLRQLRPIADAILVATKCEREDATAATAKLMMAKEKFWDVPHEMTRDEAFSVLGPHFSRDCRKLSTCEEVLALAPMKCIALPDKDEDRVLHCELRILTYIHNKVKPGKDIAVPLGVAFPCCPKCYFVIQRYNHWEGRNCLLVMGGGHGEAPANWTFPERIAGLAEAFDDGELDALNAVETDGARANSRWPPSPSPGPKDCEIFTFK